MDTGEYKQRAEGDDRRSDLGRDQEKKRLNTERRRNRKKGEAAVTLWLFWEGGEAGC